MLKKIDGFIVGLITMIIVAYLFPQFGGKSSIIPIEQITSIGISFIFFFYGLKLSPKEVLKGISNYKLHVIIQIATFVLFPALAFILKPFYYNANQPLLWMALFFMSALPSTVSSSVVMVSIAKGNIPAAIFNASISGLLGILITPLWMGIVMQSGSNGFNFLDSVADLTIRILLPVILGVILNKHFGHFARKHGKYLTLFDKSIILGIVYNSFSKSFNAKIFDSISVLELTLTFCAIVFLFALVYGIIFGISRLLNFSTEDKITAIFCGSKKSLVHGSVMVNVLFKNMSSQGIFIVPIMVYHSLQLIVISFIAQKFGRKIGEKDSESF